MQKMTTEEEMIASGKLGIHYVAMGQYDSAGVYLNRALRMPGGMSYQGGRFITNLANSYAAQGKYAMALKYYMEALRWSEQSVVEKSDGSQERLNVVRAMAGAARMYYLMGNNEQALRYAQQAKAIDEEQGWSYITPQYLYIIGSVYLDRGEWNDAERTMRQMLEFSESLCEVTLKNSGDALGMYMHIAQGLEGLAQVALAQKDYAGALEYATEAVKYADKNGNPAITARMLFAFSDIYQAQGNYEESGWFARKALELFPDYPKQNPDAEFNIAAAALFAGDREDAYEHFRLYSAQMKENTDKQFRETMAGMEVVYETEKKEIRISDLERQKILYIAICIVGVLLSVALWVIFRQKIKNERKEKQLAAANAIIEWEKKERKRFACDLHDGINGMLSAMKLELNAVEPLQNVRDQLDDCIETIRRMSRGMMPGSLERYGLKAALEDYCRLFPNVYFHFFGEDRRVDEKLELTVYYCAYELINNSFRHSGAENINVQLVQDGSLVSLTVQDDGYGFDEQSVAEGSGLKNIRDRVTAFNGNIDIASSPGGGTETNIELYTKST
jgi:signal transduction histidine kinase